jgi:hypothetical protein
LLAVAAFDFGECSIASDFLDFSVFLFPLASAKMLDVGEGFKDLDFFGSGWLSLFIMEAIDAR